MNLKAFLDRTGRTKAGLLRELGLDQKSSLISSYIAGRSKPSFEVAEGLVRLGVTASELFGEELGRLLIENSMELHDLVAEDDKYKSQEFIDAVAYALAKLKSNGNV